MSEELPVTIPSRLIGQVPFANAGIQAAIDHALDSLPVDQGDVTLRVGISGNSPKVGLVYAQRLGENWSLVAVGELTYSDGRVLPEGAVEVHGRF